MENARRRRINAVCYSRRIAHAWLDTVRGLQRSVYYDCHLFDIITYIYIPVPGCLLSTDPQPPSPPPNLLLATTAKVGRRLLHAYLYPSLLLTILLFFPSHCSSPHSQPHFYLLFGQTYLQAVFELLLLQC